jgi:hypothetical protein
MAEGGEVHYDVDGVGEVAARRGVEMNEVRDGVVGTHGLYL